MYANKKEPILVCAAQNETADLLYDALSEYGESKIIRVYSRIQQIRMEYNEE